MVGRRLRSPCSPIAVEGELASGLAAHPLLAVAHPLLADRRRGRAGGAGRRGRAGRRGGGGGARRGGLAVELAERVEVELAVAELDVEGELASGLAAHPLLADRRRGRAGGAGRRGV